MRARVGIQHVCSIATSILLVGTVGASAPIFAGAPSPAAPGEEPRLAVPVIGDHDAKRVVEHTDPADEEKLAALDPAEIHFRNGLVLRPAPGLAPDLALPPEGLLLLQVPGPVRRAWREAVDAAGFTIHDHVQNFAVIATVPQGAVKELDRLVAEGMLRYAGPYPAAAKIAPELALEAGPEVLVNVRLVAGLAPEQELRQLLIVEQERGGIRPTVRGRVPLDRIEALAAHPSVLWIGRAEPKRSHNIEASMGGGADRVVGYSQFDGTGVRVAVADTGITRTGDATQCGATGAAYHPDIGAARIADEWDFRNNDANACDDWGHGTHTAGTVGGDGWDTDDWTGIAPNVTFLIYKDCCDSLGYGYTHFDDVLTRAASHDANIVANSWGGGNGIYDQDSFEADEAVRGAYDGSDGNPQYMLVTISAGNDNYLVSSPGSAKNGITLGAMKDGNWPDDGPWCWNTASCSVGSACSCVDRPRCEDHYGPASQRICFSNYGPLDIDGDGYTRTKPDLVAPGTRICSLAPAHLGGNLYNELDGTSMSQPIAAGTAALMLDAYSSLVNWPEMLKVRMLATAADLGNRHLLGHGMLDTFHSVYDSATVATRKWEGNFLDATGAETDYTFSVTPDFQEVRVYLTWSDPASLTTEVVNDLDLMVYDSNDNLVGGSASYDDTVESVRITSGTPGTWRARVRAFNLPQPSAKYALTALEILAEPALALTTTPDSFCAGRTQPLHLDTRLSNAGTSAAISEIALDLPDDPTIVSLDDAVLHTLDPGREHVYEVSEIHHQVPINYYRVNVGLSNQNIPRDIGWNLGVHPAAAEGNYAIYVHGWARGGWNAASRTVSLQVDATWPTDVSSLVSTDRPLGSCSSDLVVDMAWNAASDPGGCGVDGYGISWTTGVPGLPPKVPGLGNVTSHSEFLPESVSPYYFNIRSFDAAANWAPWYQTWGPFWLDATAPGVVTGLGSESHPPWVCTDRPLVYMNWHGAPDDNCGLDGYSISWSEFEPAPPDLSKDIEPTTQYVQALPAANVPRFFNIRAVDQAENWSPVFESHGPIWIDDIPGEIQNLLVAHNLTDLRFGWDVHPVADFYAVYRDTDPAFSSPVLVGVTDVSGLVEAGGMLDPTSIVYYRVVGTNICGAEGP